MKPYMIDSGYYFMEIVGEITFIDYRMALQVIKNKKSLVHERALRSI